MTGTVVAGALKVAAVGLASAGIGAGIYFAAEGGSDGPESGPQVIATTASKPTPSPTPPSSRLTPTPPVPPQVDECPPGWQLLDNAVLHYTICYPPEWGIFTGESANPAATLTEEEMGRQIILAGPGWFPFPLNLPDEQIPPEVSKRVGEAPRVSLHFAQPELGFEGCQPNVIERISDLDARWCEDVFSIGEDLLPRYGPDGEVHSIKVLVPLRSPGEIAGLDTTGWRLFIKAVSVQTLYPARADLYWQIIRSVKIY